MSPQFWPPASDDSGWVTPSLISGWSGSVGNHPELRWRRINGYVEMQGAANGGVAGDPLFTFPAGSRPDIPAGKELIFAVNNGTGSGTAIRVVIRANGQVVAISGTTPVFDAVRFRVI